MMITARSPVLAISLISSVLAFGLTGPPAIAQSLIDDFESGLPVGVDSDGNPIGFHSSHGDGSFISISTTADPPAPAPGGGAGTFVMQVDTLISNWVGFSHYFENATIDTWTPRDWSPFTGLSLWLYGNNTSTTLFLDIVENRNPGSTSDDAEHFTTTITDNFSGWQLFEIPFVSFTRKDIGNGAPNDGFTLTQVHGWAFGALSGSGAALTYYIDDVKITSPVIFSDGFESGDWSAWTRVVAGSFSARLRTTLENARRRRFEPAGDGPEGPERCQPLGKSMIL